MRRISSMFLCLLMVAAVFTVGVPVNVVGEEPGGGGEGEWWVEGNGTYFELTNSTYLNITLRSSENVHVRLESVPEVVSYNIEADCIATSTEITLSGFETSKTYYRYQDGHLQEEYTTDESGSYFYTQDLTIPYHVFIQEEASTKYIRDDANGGDGYLIGNWDWPTKTLTLTTDVFEMIVIDDNGITLDGDGHSVTRGVGSYGVYASSRSGITIKNVAVSGFTTGINLQYSSSNTISGNTNTVSGNCIGIYLGYSSNSNTVSGNTVSGTGSGIGIHLFSSSSNTISGNTVSGSGGYSTHFGILLQGSSSNTISGNTFSGSGSYYHGIFLQYSSSNTLRDNAMAGNTWNFGVSGTSLSSFIQDIDTSNTVDGKPIYYWVGRSYETVPSDAGYVGIVNSDHITVQGLTLTNNWQGILFAYTTDSTIQNVDVSGNYDNILLQLSHRNTISGNTVSDNDYNGIHLSFSSSNTINGNTVSGSRSQCILLQHSHRNTISGNTVSGNYNGILLEYSNSNTVSGNTVSGNKHGIYLTSYSSSNTINGNTFSGNDYGILLRCISSNTVSGNIVSGNEYGIIVDRSSSNTISGNTVSGNYNGIHLSSSSSNTIFHNDIIDNTIQLNNYQSTNTWDNGDGEGNYWSDYTGEDIGGMYYPWDIIEKHLIADDGVGDTEVPHPYEGIDYYPLMSSNQPPMADAGGPYIEYEGTAITFDASGSTDPDGDPLEYRWDFDNDGTWDTDYSTDPTATNTWNDDYSGLVAVEVSDGSLTDTAEESVNILNADPIIIDIISPIDPTPVGTPTDISAHFTDPGILDTHTAEINWGDGNITNGVVDEIGGSGTVTGSWIYTTPGVYLVTLTVWDDDSGEDSITTEYVVIFDPTGAFVTGGGMIDSPPGAYVPDPSLTGKAGFGFFSKYQKGNFVPNGNTQFRFQAADFRFQSSSYDWMVVAGPKAMFKGTGEINGEGNYGFLISAIDGEQPGGGGVDKFRIKIWDKDNFDIVVYDNGLGDAEDADPGTPLTHGSIKIHKG